VKHAIKDKKAGSFINGLMLAAGENDLYLAQVLIQHGCNLNLLDHNNRNALFHAINSAFQDQSEMVNLLVNSGVNLNQVDADGLSPLTLAVLKGDKEIVRILLNSGADVNHQVLKDGNTALHYVVNLNKPELIQLLLLKKPELSIRNKNNQTPMEIAAGLSRTEVYQILAEEYNLRERELSKRKEEIVALNSQVNSQVNYPTHINTSHSSHAGVGKNNIQMQMQMDNNNNYEFEEQSYIDEDTNLSNKMHNLHLNAKFMSQVAQNNTHVNNTQVNINNNSHSHMHFNMNNMNNMSNLNNVNNVNSMSNVNNMSSLNNVNNVSNLNNMNIMNTMSNVGTNQNYNNFHPMHQGTQSTPNINTSTLSSQSNRNGTGTGNGIGIGIPFSQKFTKNAKMQKLRYLQESRQFAEQTGRSIKDKTFRFPSNNVNNIEIPFSFQPNPDGRLGGSQGQPGQKFQKGNQQLHTFISNIYIFLNFFRNSVDSCFTH
jgi:ankyrin repeat protein